MKQPRILNVDGELVVDGWLLDETDRTELGWVPTWHLHMGNAQQTTAVLLNAGRAS